MSKKLPPMLKKIAFTYSIKRNIGVAFEKKCKELDVNKSNVIESLMEEFLR